MDDLGDCHSLAQQILEFDEDYAAFNGQYINEANCIYYSQPDEDGYKLIVSLKDRSVLWAGKIIPTAAHIKAFKEGLRSDQNIVFSLI